MPLTDTVLGGGAAGLHSHRLHSSTRAWVAFPEEDLVPRLLGVGVKAAEADAEAGEHGVDVRSVIVLMVFADHSSL